MTNIPSETAKQVLNEKATLSWSTADNKTKKNQRGRYILNRRKKEKDNSFKNFRM